MSNRISKIPNDVQNRNSIAWKKLCEYIDDIAENGKDEFVPREALGDELFSEIYILPESISKLKKVKKIGLYGSKLKRIPPEIGEMESLEYFDPYTSYDLNWIPYEITNCKKLKDSRISTRALYGNFKNRKGFPRLEHNPVRYYGDKLNCSVCKKRLTYEETNQYWLSLKVGTDVLPLLTNLCSNECLAKLPTPPKYYVQYPHRGGSNLEQPNIDEWDYMKENLYSLRNQNKSVSKESKEVNTDWKQMKLIKLVRKIWEK